MPFCLVRCEEYWYILRQTISSSFTTGTGVVDRFNQRLKADFTFSSTDERNKNEANQNQ